MSAPFDAGAIESTLDVNRDPWQQGLAASRREGREWAKTRWAATLDADPKALDTALRKARSDLSGFGRGRYTATLGVALQSGDLRTVDAQLSKTASKRRDIALRATLAGGSAVLAELAALDQAAARVDGREVRLRAVLDGAPLVISEIDTVDMAARRIDGRNLTMNVDLDGGAALAAQLAAIESERAAADGKTVTVRADSSQLDGLILKFGLLALAASTASVAAAGGLLGLSVGATAALPGLGAVALGFGGITDAVKATTDQQKKSGAAAARSGAQAAAAADAQVSAAASLQNAERSLANARENARDSAVRASQATARAREQAGERVADAARREQQAERAVGDAIRDRARVAERGAQTVARAARAEKDARDALNESYRTAAQRMEDLQFQVVGGALAEQRAVLNLRKATKELDDARRAGVNGDALDELTISYGEAELAVNRVRVENGRLATEKQDSDRRGVAGSKEVTAAQRQLGDAVDATRQARRDAADQWEAANERIARAEEAARDASAAVDKARRDGRRMVADAIAAEERQARQSAQAIAAAEASREAALRQVASAQRKATEATDGGTAAVDKAREAMEKLSPAGRNFVRFLTGLEPTWRRLQQTAQTGLLPGVQSGIEALLRREPRINEFVDKYSRAMGGLAQRTGEGLASQKWTDWFDWLGDQATPTLDRFGSITGHALGGTAQLLRGASPLWYEMGDAIDRGLAAYERWGDEVASGKSEGFNRFMDLVRTYGPEVWDTVVALARGGGQLVESLAPLGGVVLDAAEGVGNFIAACPPGVLQAIAVGVLAVAAAWKSVTIVNAISTQVSRGKAALETLTSAFGATAGGVRTLLTPSLLAATGPMQRLQGGASTLAGKLGAGEQAAGRFGSRVSGLASSLPLLGVAIAGLAIYADATSSSLDEAAVAMEKGGQSAREMADAIRAQNSEPIMGDNWINDFNTWLKKELGIATSVEEARAALEKRRAEMSNTEAAQSRLTEAQGNYDLAVKEHGPMSREAADAAGELAARTEAVAVANLAARDGIDLATAAMRNQTDEALAAVDAGIRKERADRQAADAQTKLADAIRDHGAGSKEAADADLDLRESQARAAQAAKDGEGGQRAYNDTVAKFVEQAKGPLNDTLVGLVNGMDAAGLASIGARYDIDETGQAVYRLPDGRTVKVNADTAAALTGIEGVRFALQNVPAGKQVVVDALDQPAQDKLRALGFTVDTLPDGTVAVTANDEKARGTLLAFQQFADWQEAHPDLAADPAKAEAAMRGFLEDAGRQTGVPMLDADPARADQEVRDAVGRYNTTWAKMPVAADTAKADQDVRSWWEKTRDWFRDHASFSIPNPFASGGTAPGASGGMAPVRMAGGGVLAGYAPGVDDVHAVMSRGESVLVPELTRAIGPDTIMAANYAASGRRGTRYSGGGVASFAGGGVPAVYAAAGGIAAAAGATRAATSGTAGGPSGDPGAADAAAEATDGMTSAMVAAAGAAGVLDPMLAQLAATQTGVLAPAQDAVTAGQQTLVAAGIGPLASALSSTLAPTLARYGQQIGVDAPAADAALQGAQMATRASTDATAANTAANAGVMTGAVVATSAAQQREHGLIRGAQGATAGSTDALVATTQAGTGAMTGATRQTSLAQQSEHGAIRGAHGLTMGSTDVLARNTGARSGDMSAAVGGMSGQTQFHLGQVRGAQGTTTGATTAFADSWRDQLGRTVPDSANPLRHVINVPIGGIVNAWNTLDSQFALGKHVNPPAANFATGGVAGVLPGYTPGRDTMTIGVGGGEAIMRPEWTRAVGRDYVDDGNAAARRGGVAGVQSFLTGAAVQNLMRTRPLDDSPQAARSGRRWGGRFAYGGVAPHVAAAGDAVTRALGPMPGGIGGRGSRGNASDHPSGFALDFMTMANMALGDRVAGLLSAQAEPMAVKYLIWRQQINQGRGWNRMEDRGSPTANHMDHVHASFEGGPLGGKWGDGPAGGAMFDFTSLIRDAFGFVFDQIAQVPRMFGPSDQVARAAGVPKAGAEMAIAALVTKLTSIFSAGGGGGNAAAFRPQIGAALGMLGLPQAWAASTERRMNQESGGDPKIVNTTDSNWARGTPSVGLMQVIGPTYRANADPRRNVGPYLYGTSIDPLSNILASMRYTMGRYGSLPAGYDRAGGYDNGGPWLPDTAGWNGSGEVETVLSADQGRALGRRLDVDDRLAGIVGGRGTVSGDGPSVLAALERMTARIEAAVAEARGITVYGAPHQSEESIAEITVRRDQAARRTVRI